MKTVYAIVDEDTGKIVYIGCTKMTIHQRMYFHWYQRYKRNVPMSIWMQSLNEIPYAYELERVIHDEDGYDAESRWIRFFRGVPGIQLLNVSDSHGSARNFGVSGNQRSKKTRDKISQSLLGVPTSEASHQHGEKNGNAKLTDHDVLMIRQEPVNVTLREIAEKYGVSLMTVHNIRTRKSWKHILKNIAP